MGVLLKGVLIDLGANNFVHTITSLHARCVRTHHHACNLSSPDAKYKILNTSTEIVSRAVARVTINVLFYV